MYVTEIATGMTLDVSVEPLLAGEYKLITKGRFFFDWKKEKEESESILKLKRDDTDEILGVVSFSHHPKEKRIFIQLLAVSTENRGKDKKYDRIAGNLIAYLCREAYTYYGGGACVSLQPKTNLKAHYRQKYDMKDSGPQVYLDGLRLINLLNEYAL